MNRHDPQPSNTADAATRSTQVRDVLRTAGLAEPVEGSVRLSDGRQLSYAEYGDRSGSPVFHFHGHPGSRLEAELLHEPALDAGIRLIGVDRPGMGFSSFLKNRSLLDWPADIARLADELGLERFAVQGISGGGPYAAAVAHRVGDRLSATILISSAGPGGLGIGPGDLAVNRLQRRLVRVAPWVLDLAFASLGRSVQRQAGAQGPEQVSKAALAGLPEIDRRALADPYRAERYGRSLVEAFRQGGKGAAWDARILSRPWGFDLGEIAAENVHVWQGGLDRNVPPTTGPAMSAAIPGAVEHFHEGEGHTSIAFHHAADILGAAAR